jgi:hypothetical protein
MRSNAWAFRISWILWILACSYPNLRAACGPLGSGRVVPGIDFPGTYFDGIVKTSYDLNAEPFSFNLSASRHQASLFVLVNRPGGGSCDWRVEVVKDNQPSVPWVYSVNARPAPYFSITSSDNGQVNFTVDPNDSGATRQFRVQIKEVSTNNLLVEAKIKQWHASGDTSPPQGWLDTPQNGNACSVASLSVNGWAVDNRGLWKVDLYRDPWPSSAGSSYTEANPAAVQTVAGQQVVFIGSSNNPGQVYFTKWARPDIETPILVQ